MTVRQASASILWLTALLVGCASGESPSRDSIAGGHAGAQPAISDTTGSAPAVPTLSSERRAALEKAANEVVMFLAGRERFETLSLADTVELHLVPEGAGTSEGVSVRVGRAALRNRGAWKIDARGRSYSFVPSQRLTKATVRAGTHFNCQEVPLASRVPRLAARPHVGVRLEPPEPKSCLETWNASFVFDTSGVRPRVVAAVYDQWEW